MPGKSGPQRRAAALGLAIKRGEAPASGGAAGQMARSMTTQQLRDFAKKPGKGKSK